MLDAHIATLSSTGYSAKIATIRWCKGTCMTEDVDYTQMSGRSLLLESSSNQPHNLLLLLLLTYHYKLMLTCP
jgi:hypothetical protein